MNNPIILFDGICNLCNASVNFIIKNDRRRRFRFAALQSQAGQNILTEHNFREKDFNTVVLVENGRILTKSSAALQIAKKLGFPFNIFFILIIVPIYWRDKIYDFIALKRYKWFGKKENCMIPSEETKDLFLE